jgi:hypothetical protein
VKVFGLFFVLLRFVIPLVSFANTLASGVAVGSGTKAVVCVARLAGRVSTAMRIILSMKISRRMQVLKVGVNQPLYH